MIATSTSRKIKNIFLYCLMLVALSCTTYQVSGQCLTAANGQWPAATYTPTACNGIYQTITTTAYAGEYSKVSLTAGVAYTFASSVSTDYITISNNGGTAPAFAFGTTPITYTSATTQVIRFYTHTSSACGAQSVNRTRSIRCGTPCSLTALTNDVAATTSTYPTNYSATAAATSFPSVIALAPQGTNHDLTAYGSTCQSGTVLGSSAINSGSTVDFISIGYNNSGIFYPSAETAGGGTSVVEFQQATSTMTLGSASALATIGTTEAVDLFETPLLTAGTAYNIKLNVTSGNCNLGFALVSEGTGGNSITNRAGSALIVDANGAGASESGCNFTPTVSAYYSLVIFNNQSPLPSVASNYSVIIEAAANTVTSSAAATICSGGTVNIPLTASKSGSTFTWVAADNPNTTGESTTLQTGSTLNNTITNNTTSAQNVIYTVTPISGPTGCPGTAKTVTVTVNSTPSFSACPSNISTTTAAGVCTKAVTYTATAAGTPAPTVTYVFTGATTGSGSGTGTGATFNKGVTTVTITAANGCTPNATCSFTVTVTDNQNPLITCPANISLSTTAGTCARVVSFVATATDNCPGTVITYSQNPGTSFPKGTTTVTATATDASGNIHTCSFTVTINDTENPTIVNLPANISQSTDAGLCTAVVTWTAPTSADNCPGSSIAQTAGPASGSAFPKGVTTISYTATDAAGNTSIQSFTVTVNDTEDPLITCPSNITQSNDAGLCGAVVNFTATATDNCSGTVITYSQNPGTTFPVGVTTVTATATDASGRIATCSFTVTVNDTQNPVITCPSNITQNNDAGVCGAVVNFSATATDNCAGTVVTYSQNPGTSFPPGATTVTATATDASGNIAACSFTVTVTDTEAPEIICPSNITQGNDAGVCGAIVNFTATATDNCPSAVTITYSQDPGTSFPVGTTIVTATATDLLNNSSQCTFNVTVNDTENPTIVNLPADITQSNEAGTCGAVITWTEPTASDNCSGSSIAQTAGPSSGSTFPAGITTISYTGTDASNNTTTQSFTVTVNDTENPVVACPADQTFCKVEGDTYIIPLFTATDNCGTSTITYDITGATTRSGAGNDATGIFVIGTSTIVWTATDGNSNIGICSTTVTIRPLLPTPGPISGPTDACPLIGNPVPTTYSIDPVAGAVTYTWTVPVGATLVSGQGTTAIGVTFDNSFALTNSRFTVKANATATACESLQSVLIVFKNVPGIPLSISGPTNVCPYAGQQTTATYSIAAVQYATSYSWVVSANAAIVSGQGTTSVEVSFTNNFNFGNIQVTANSNCGSRSARSLSISKKVPATPVSISGPTNACPYVGTSTQATYSIAAVANAESYTWTIPANVNLISGQGTTSIDVTFNSGYTTSLFKVKAVATCQSSADRTLSVAATTYGAPGPISGPTNACSYIGTGVEAIYTVRKVQGAPSYNWIVPNGVTITAHPGGAGVNDTIIKVTFNNNFVSGTSITVQTTGCFNSASSSITITRTAGSNTPGPITGPTNACEYMVSSANPGGLPATYTIRKVSGVTSYTWTAPSGATISAHPAGPGVNDTIVEVTYSNTFTSGTIMAASSNGCGISPPRSLSVGKFVPGAPRAIDIVQTGTCPNREYIYTMQSYPTNATSIVWTVPAGAIIVSGQNTLSITVSYPATSVNGTVTATPYNNCGNSNTRSINIKFPACTPGFAGRGNVPTEAKTSVGKFVVQTMELHVFPNPSVSDFKVQVLSSDKEMINVRILDLQGRALIQMNVLPSETITLGAQLKAGSYMIVARQGNHVKTSRVIKF